MSTEKRISEIKKTRDSLGLKNNHIAKKIGIHPGTLSSVLSNDPRYATDSMLGKIEGYLANCST